MTIPGHIDGLVDSHCHLQLGPHGGEPADPARLLRRARESGVEWILVPGTDLESSRQAREVTAAGPGLVFAAGFHPHEANRWEASAERGIEALLADPRCVAVGEIGLDYFYDHSPREDQRRVLRRQLSMARAAGLPVILHNRESAAEMVGILREPEFAGLTGVFHSFCDTPQVADDALALGYFASYSGMVTFRAADNVRETVPRIPSDRLLVETDTPYLAPVPHRGKPNEPAFVELVLRRVADLRGDDPAALADRVRENFLALFPRARNAG